MAGKGAGFNGVGIKRGHERGMSAEGKLFAHDERWVDEGKKASPGIDIQQYLRESNCLEFLEWRSSTAKYGHCGGSCTLNLPSSM